MLARAAILEERSRQIREIGSSYYRYYSNLVNRSHTMNWLFSLSLGLATGCCTFCTDFLRGFIFGKFFEKGKFIDKGSLYKIFSQFKVSAGNGTRAMFLTTVYKGSSNSLRIFVILMIFVIWIVFMLDLFLVAQPLLYLAIYIRVRCMQIMTVRVL